MFLCHTISSEDIEVDLKETEAIKICPRPSTPTDFTNFLGLAVCIGGMLMVLHALLLICLP